MTADQVTILNEAFDALDASFAIDLSGSAAKLQLAQPSNYHYKEAWLGVELIADPTCSLFDLQSSLLMELVASMRALQFDNPNGINTVRSYAECSPAKSLTEDSVADEGGEKILKQGYKMIILDTPHRR